MGVNKLGNRPIFNGVGISTANSTATKFIVDAINYFGATSAKTYHLPAPTRGQWLSVKTVAATTAAPKTKIRATTGSNSATVTIASSLGTKQSLVFSKAGQYAQLVALSTAKWLVIAMSPGLTATSS